MIIGPTTAGAGYTSAGPCRVFDTRTGTGSCAGTSTVTKAPLGAGATLTLKISGVGGVPATATAVILNVTATGATTSTYITVWPAGGAVPVVSNLNVNSSAPVPNLVVVPVSADGSISTKWLDGFNHRVKVW